MLIQPSGKNVYQFKVSLKNIKPQIWRSMQVAENYTFWDLHVAIQDVMGWQDSHLHQFEIKDPTGAQSISIGIPDEEFSETTLTDWETFISDYFSSKNKNATYLYDFGDNWEHQITLEKILPAEANKKYPLCLAGERACPPEDCGGIYGYQNFIEIMNDPSHEEYEDMCNWLGKNTFRSEKFDPKKVKFSDPKKRLKEIRS